MQIKELGILKGPNQWTHRPVMEIVVICSPLNYDVDQTTTIFQRGAQRYPRLQGFSDLQLLLNKPLNQEECVLIWLSFLEKFILLLQQWIGCEVQFSQTIKMPTPEVYTIVVEYFEETVARAVTDMAGDFIQYLINDHEHPLEQTIESLKDLYHDKRLGPSTYAIVQAAVAKNIPCMRMSDYSLVQLGWGAKQRRILASETDETSAIAEEIAQDKDLTKRLLDQVGIPVPKGQVISTEEVVWPIACEIGLPVVIKPLDSNQGKGVTTHLVNQEQCEAAVKAAAKFSQKIIVESYLAGDDYRLLVVGDQLAAAAKREKPHVVGDGMNTIATLVEMINRDPKRGKHHNTSLTKIEFDEIVLRCLATQNYTPDAIPSMGEKVILRNNANLSTGGTAVDVTQLVHPHTAQLAVLAAKMIGLDVCGIDVICQDISKPFSQQLGAGFIEVNAAPGLRMHLDPLSGQKQPIGDMIVTQMFGTSTGRIPVVTVTGTNGKTTVVRLIAYILRQLGRQVGMTNTSGIYFNDQMIEEGDCSGPNSARKILSHPLVDTAVFETARGGILRQGLGFDQCDVAVVTNIGQGDHLGLNHIHTVEQLAMVKQAIVSAVSPQGTAVLNADDEHVAKMANVCKGNVIYFSLNKDNPTITQHLAAGQRVAFYDQRHVVLQGPNECYRLDIHRIPMTHQGQVYFQIANAMASLAAVWALGYAVDCFESHALSFTGDAVHNPGRFNYFQHNGATIIADYGHNVDAMEALMKVITHYPANRRILLTSTPGDRLDSHIMQQMVIVGELFDVVILYQDTCQRGRVDGELFKVMRQGLANASRVTTISEILDEQEAIQTALAMLAPGDFCLLLIEDIAHTLSIIERHVH